jgi:hypothetical protein
MSLYDDDGKYGGNDREDDYDDNNVQEIKSDDDPNTEGSEGSKPMSRSLSAMFKQTLNNQLKQQQPLATPQKWIFGLGDSVAFEMTMTNQIVDVCTPYGELVKRLLIELTTSFWDLTHQLAQLNGRLEVEVI